MQRATGKLRKSSGGREGHAFAADRLETEAEPADPGEEVDEGEVGAGSCGGRLPAQILDGRLARRRLAAIPAVDRADCITCGCRRFGDTQACIESKALELTADFCFRHGKDRTTAADGCRAFRQAGGRRGEALGKAELGRADRSADGVRGATCASPRVSWSMLGDEAAGLWSTRLAHTFTTLRHPVEKLLEAEHFLARLVSADGLQFPFELNALLSASRSVTFVLQRAMAHVPGFAEWYERKQAHMSEDPAMRFFVKLRNISQKDGPVSFAGGSLLGGGWTYRFVGGPEALPDELAGRDIGACCAAHLVKLASLLLDCVHVFPFHACPARAMREEGMAALGYEWRDVEVALGLPPGYAEVPAIPARERLRLLRREFEPLDVESIKRIAGRRTPWR